MGTTKVNICNSALAKVGATRISSLDDDKKQARLCKELYTIITQQMIESHPWNFAISRVEVAAVVAAPAFGFSYQFQVPSDCLRILNLQDDFSDDTVS